MYAYPTNYFATAPAQTDHVSCAGSYFAACYFAHAHAVRPVCVPVLVHFTEVVCEPLAGF